MTTTLTTFADLLDEARRYLGEYDQARVITREQAVAEVIERAAQRWWGKHDLGAVSDEVLADLHRLVEEEADAYAGEIGRYLDDTYIGPCIARDLVLGYAWLPRALAEDEVVDNGCRYAFYVWEDGSCTLDCTEPDAPENEWWSYPFAPNEDVRWFEGVPQHVLGRFHQLKQEAIESRVAKAS
jgi:hypothetical protein